MNRLSPDIAAPAWVELLPAELRTMGDASLWRSIEAGYATPPRAYHSFAHIEACLKAAQPLAFDNVIAVTLAIVFHDIVYIAGRKDNETESARFMHATLAPYVRAAAAPAQRALTQALPHAARMIEATANHLALPADAPQDDKRMLDIDLGILATPPNVYARYAQQVRAEWVPAVVTDAQFNAGRAAFLRQMLAAPRLFHSAEFASSEAPARENMRQELANYE
jgi:predicted metal-dependent HD superfamily phosphohydrolase